MGIVSEVIYSLKNNYEDWNGRSSCTEFTVFHRDLKINISYVSGLFCEFKINECEIGAIDQIRLYIACKKFLKINTRYKTLSDFGTR